ncbi:helix-hairpin-helix domain-containing protein [Tengunoibacter tsumagoiensis]|uniref:Soluble ligand binding domain-containing protein n=1 Tax=Tengunoibacter tsumagoiensis TaxID=2014871 RepID=A0A401ZXP0_9CHLR|nr:ComEA family DNA-binding protein [Tengunoibacter tsumagoiensis]GCE11602.1 hypothetical protein KTT_14610 [Tengunoibacter tsumagoiensis]
MATVPTEQRKSFNLRQFHLSQQQTAPFPAVSLTPITPPVVDPPPLAAHETLEPSPRKQVPLRRRLLISGIILALAVVLYIIWHPTTATTPSSLSAQNNPSTMFNTTPSVETPHTTTGDIQAYVAGAVLHPGVYTLMTNARVYQLLQAAGGPLSSANLAMINLAARLIDGQEVYVPHIGETPPVSLMSGTATVPTTTSDGSPGQLVNINSASSDELRQRLHLSSRTAQTIINYRVQHGPFTSVDQLLQVVSKTIYTKIQGMVTVT